MITVEQLKTKVNNKEQVVIAIIGDSTTCGFGANGGVNLWSNGLSYLCVNSYNPNLQSDSPYFINTSGTPTEDQQNNKAIPSAVRLLRTYLEADNTLSKVYNLGVAGYTASMILSSNLVGYAANLSPKPQAIFFNLGINSAKNGQSQDGALRALVSQAIANDILPILVKPHNIAYWSMTATPDTWVAFGGWINYRNNIQQIADDNNLSVIDLGSEDCEVDITLMYDGFHPSNLGYVRIAKIYEEWLTDGKYFIFTRNGKKYNHVKNGNGAFKVKINDGRILELPLTMEEQDFIKIKNGNNLATFK